MKAIFKLIYDTENFEQVQEIEDMRHGRDYKLVLYELNNMLREQIKYNCDLSEEVKDAYDKIRTNLWQLLKENNLSLD
jgi:hypothetical protein